MSRRYQLGRHWKGTRLNAALISTFLDPDAETAIDIGANEGAFSIVLAKHGLSVTAVEPGRKAFEIAEIMNQRMRLDIKLENRSLALEDIEALDPVDVSLLLSVHHQIVAAKGLDPANAFLRSLAAKTTRQLFFQPACIHRKYRKAVPFGENDMGAIIDYFISLLQDIFPHSAMIGFAPNDVPAIEPLRPLLLFSHSPIEPRGGRDAVVIINELRRAAWATHPVYLGAMRLLKPKKV